MTRASFDALVTRLADSLTSLSERELLQRTHWVLGEDARLREDLRFRQTPWGHWMLAEDLIANDAIYRSLHAEGRSSIALEAALARAANHFGRRCVFCTNDPRFVLRQNEIRLAASDLSRQATRLGRRIAAFFDGTALDGEDDDTNETMPTGWRTRLVCLDVAAGGLQLEVGPLNGLPPFVKKLRVVGETGWDGFVIAANVRARVLRVPVRPGSGPWRWEAVGFEDEQDLGLENLALDAIDSNAAIVFRIDPDGIGQQLKSTTLAVGQAYRLLLPPNVGVPSFGVEIDSGPGGGWRLWSTDLAAPLTPTTRELLTSVGLNVGEAWPRIEWALTPVSAWRTNARGESYPVFDLGTEVFVNVDGLSSHDSDTALLFLHGRSGTDRLQLSASGLVSLGTLAAGRWACALLHPRTSVQSTTLVFEVVESAIEHVAAEWTATAPNGLSSLEVTAPPGWPVALRWETLSSELLTTHHAEDDGTIGLELARVRIEDRLRTCRLANFIIDLGELGARTIAHERRPSIHDVRNELTKLWELRSAFVKARAGAWLQLMPAWFKPVTELLGYGLEPLPATDAEAPHDLAAWLLTVDERVGGSITRSTSRVLVVTTDIDAVLRDCRAWIDSACSAARVRDAIVTDGTRWTTHRKGSQQLKQHQWSLDDAIGRGSVEDMLNDLAEGL